MCPTLPRTCMPINKTRFVNNTESSGRRTGSGDRDLHRDTGGTRAHSARSSPAGQKLREDEARGVAPRVRVYGNLGGFLETVGELILSYFPAISDSSALRSATRPPRSAAIRPWWFPSWQAYS